MKKHFRIIMLAAIASALSLGIAFKALASNSPYKYTEYLTIHLSSPQLLKNFTATYTQPTYGISISGPSTITNGSIIEIQGNSVGSLGSVFLTGPSPHRVIVFFGITKHKGSKSLYYRTITAGTQLQLSLPIFVSPHHYFITIKKKN